MLIDKVNNRIRIYHYKVNYKFRMFWYWLLMKAGKFDNNSLIEKLVFDEEWEHRIRLALNSEYNLYIPRVAGAGNISDGFQTMHNGLQVSTGEYYGLPITKMLYLNKGVHEPEEEKMFMEVLNKMPEKPVMLELGAFWAFYSMWFLKATKEGCVFMVEPEIKHIKIGMRNFKHNHLQASFDNYLIGKESFNNNGETPVISLDDYIQKKGISHINIAHADIQGFEMEMLEGAKKCFQSRMIDYFFVSTHTNELHEKCIRNIQQQGYKIVFDVVPSKAASFDGFILALSPALAC